MTDPHVIIAGGGIGGVGAALMLGRRGISVTLLEREPRFAEGGYGLQLGPNVTRTLREEGVFEAITGRAVFPRRLVFRYDLGGAFFSQYSLPPQFSIMQGLYARGLPVPKALWLDADGAVNGKSGLFMERIEGIAPSTMPFNEGPYMAVDAAGRHLGLQGVLQVGRQAHVAGGVEIVEQGLRAAGVTA